VPESQCSARPAVTDPHVRRLGVLVALVLGLFWAVAPASAASAFDEGTIHALTNQSRAANGLGSLTLNASLNQVAVNWANQMAANGRMSHNPNYSGQIPGGWSSAAENVAQGYPSGAAVHEGWMNSAGHRANILGDFTDIGIAHISAGGTTWSVEVFAKYGSSAPAPQPAPAPPPPAPVPAPAPVPEPEPEPVPETSADSDPNEASATPSASPRSPAGDPTSAERSAASDSDGSESANTASKLVLGIALVVAVAIAVVGWLRVSRHRAS
jgi:uncharacterized protein YkwD